MKIQVAVLLTIIQLSYVSFAFPSSNDEQRYFWLPDIHGEMQFIDLLDETPPVVKYNPIEDIVYYLHTNINPGTGQIIKKGDIDSFRQSNFNLSNPVKFTIHGWGDSYHSATNFDIMNAFFGVMDTNVIAVDWSIGAAEGYVGSVRNVPLTAYEVAEFIDWLHELGVAFSNIHILGHSLGAHVAGITARSVTLGQVEYVSALDPAGPSWSSSSLRVRKTDAKYVEAIHTNGGLLGLTDAVGHNDFYPNGGKHMPGCGTDMGCSHSRAREYMVYSIDNEFFEGVQCDSTAEALNGVESCAGTETLHMGGSKIKPEMGIFALNTDADRPYYLG